MKQLKNKIAPYEEHGRWYHFFIEADSDTLVLTTTDIEGAELSGNYLVLPEGYSIIDMKNKIHSIEGGSALNTALLVRIYNDARQGVAIPSSNNCDYCEVWIFANKE